MLSVRSLLVAAILALVAAPAFALTDTSSDSIDFGGSGYVSQGGTFEYQHTFDPYFDDGIEISAINSSWLYVSVVDDWNCDRLRGCLRDWWTEGEVAAIDLNSVSWATGSATASILYGDVTAEADLLNNNGVLDVRVSSDQGDFMVLWSSLVTSYEYEIAGSGGGIGTSGGTSPMPEPSAALVFAIGALVMRGTVRRRRLG